jgi:phosphatidylserine decarboxylase
MTSRPGFLSSFADLLVPVHREGHRLVLAAAAAAIVLLWLWAPLGWIAVLATILLALHFRDPDRVIPLRDGLVLAPADGTIADTDELTPPPELGFGPEPRARITIQILSTDGHIQRAPIAGRIVRTSHLPAASGEGGERRSTVIAARNGTEIAVVQIGGALIRKTVAFQDSGASIGAGERIGLIRFGGRVELYLPPGRRALVSVGQHMIAGETVVADLASSEPPREARKI